MNAAMCVLRAALEGLAWSNVVMIDQAEGEC